MTQNNLANAYSNRINGSRADNLERAIEFYQAALTVYTLEDFPEDWAMTQNNLANAYSNRINGSRADNLERAIEFYQLL
jgi:predicted enzyme related to lactoylglutathione lyase